MNRTLRASETNGRDPRKRELGERESFLREGLEREHEKKVSWEMKVAPGKERKGDHLGNFGDRRPGSSGVLRKNFGGGVGRREFLGCPSAGVGDGEGVPGDRGTGSGRGLWRGEGKMKKFGETGGKVTPH